VLFTFQEKHIKEQGFTHERIKSELQENFKSLIYYCLSDEIGLLSLESGTEQLHTHVFAMFGSPVRASTLNRHFPTVHRDFCRGTARQNREYIAKIGSWENTEKCGTKVEGSFEEWGDLPEERQGARNDIAELYMMIKDGATNFEILEHNPGYMTRLTDIERTRLTVKEEEFKEVFRELEVTYIWGATRLGKTRYVMEKHGYANVFRVNDYSRDPFQGYRSHDVLCFDEFVGQDINRGVMNISDMNDYMDGYPIVLPCRYSNKQACYTKVYVISNIDLWYQFRDVRVHDFSRWEAFVARFNKVIKFNDDGTRTETDPIMYRMGAVEANAVKLN
jgi:hypothetical protein